MAKEDRGYCRHEGALDYFRKRMRRRSIADRKLKSFQNGEIPLFSRVETMIRGASMSLSEEKPSSSFNHTRPLIEGNNAGGLLSIPGNNGKRILTNRPI